MPDEDMEGGDRPAWAKYLNIAGAGMQGASGLPSNSPIAPLGKLLTKALHPDEEEPEEETTSTTRSNAGRL